MIYLVDAVYEWLNTTCPDTVWIVQNQVNAPAKPQSAPSFGYFEITIMHKQSMKSMTDVFNPDTGKIDRTLQDYYKAKVSIDILSQDESNPGTDAALIAASLIANLNSPYVYEYFFKNNIGFLYTDSFADLSGLESAQVRKRIHFDAHFSLRMDFETELDYIAEVPVIYNIEEY